MKCACAVAVLVVMVTYAAGLAVMSVDMGSEFMKVAIVKPGVPMEIAYNKESKRKTPVIVSIKDGERLFGDPAANVNVRYPKHAYKYLLDLMGKKFSNPLVKAYLKRFPYYEMEADPDTGLVRFIHDQDTTYTVEELMAMILEKTKEIASDFAEQPITDAVITVPAYFNQAERRAMLRAGELAGIKVLQLLNHNTAVGLNYGVFRRKEFNATASHYMFFDMGASSTVATVVGYQLVKVKNPVTGVEETFPQMSVKGVGFDRTLGGLELQLRLRDHLAKLFTKVKKTPSDVYQSPRAMGKLFKEAGRLKQVLSANTDHMAQIEGLLDDEDFRGKVNREEFEEMNADVFKRVANVVQDALKSSEITLDEIVEVILMGASTRVPKIQEELQKAVNRQELGKSINTDEAAAMGASYQAAHLSKGYKVKKFGIKDANIFPIQVEFERVRTTDDSTDASKTVKRTLFGRMNPFPQKKVMTFNKHTKDFSFVVNYGELGFLSDEFLQSFGKPTLQEVALLGIEDVHTKHKDEAEPKGTKAHFRMDDNGILKLDKVETLFEKIVNEEVEVEIKEESTLSKIGNTISSFFGGGEKEKPTESAEGGVEEGKEEAKEQETGDDAKKDTTQEDSGKAPVDEGADKKDSEQDEEKEKESDDKTETDKKDPEEKPSDSKEKPSDSEKKPSNSEEKPSDSEEKPKDAKEDAPGKDAPEGTKTDETKDEKPATEKVVKTKTVTVKEEIKSDVLLVDLQDPSEDHLKVSQKKIEEMRKKDEEKMKLEKVKNELEGFIFDTQDKIYQEVYEAVTAEDERQGYQQQLSEASDWLYEQDETADRKVYEKKLKDLKKLTSDMFARVREAEERPKALEALKSVVNYTEFFLAGMRNLTGEDLPFTEVEVTTLDKLITSTKEWNTTMHEEQSKVPANEKPKLLVEDIARKISDLDREVKYLLNKMKTYRPKTKPKTDTKSENKTESVNKKDKDTDKKTDNKDDKTKKDAKKTEADSDTQPDSTDQSSKKPASEDPPATDEAPSDQAAEGSDDKEEPLQLPESDTGDATSDTPTTDSTTKQSGHDASDL